jgi:glycine C-acetyltransferase
MVATRKADNTRDRDIAGGCPRARALHGHYEDLLQSSDLALIGRVFHASSGSRATVSYAGLATAEAGSVAPRSNMINLGSSDYAGLNRHPRVIQAATEALHVFGNSSTGGRLLNGTTDLHVLLERKLAEFLGVEDAITYNSGYCANLTTFSTLCAPGDVVISDILNHQSIADGLALGGAESVTYLHSSMRGTARSVETILRRLPRGRRKFIVTDGVFSMDGDVAPLDEVVSLADEYNAFVIVDDAHATGALGPCGRGTVAHFGLDDQVDVITGVLSKGLPGIGGFAAGPKRTIDLLRYGSHGYIFSTALPPSVVAGLIAAIDILRESPEIQERLHRNVRRFRDGVEALGFDVLGSQSAVIPLPMPDAATTLRFARMLHEDGVYVNAAIYPAVSPLRPRLRVNVNASLDVADIDAALESIQRCMARLQISPRSNGFDRPHLTLS